MFQAQIEDWHRSTGVFQGLHASRYIYLIQLGKDLQTPLGSFAYSHGVAQQLDYPQVSLYHRHEYPQRS